MHNLGLINHRCKHHHYSNLSGLQLNNSSTTLHLKTVDNRTHNSRLKINVSGQMYETYEDTLNKYPETILGTREKRRPLTDLETGIMFLNRHRASFEAILFFFQSSGNLVRPQNILMSHFVEECRFYQIPENAIKRMKHRECFLYTKRNDQPSDSLRNNCWFFIENPKEFGGAVSFVYFLFSYTLILSSVFLYCIHTEIILHKASVDIDKFFFYQNRIELALNLFFAVELGVRFLACPRRREFLLESTNFFELISVTSYLTIAVILPPKSVHGNVVLSISRTLYTFRITRLARMSEIVKMSFTVFHEAFDDVAAVLFTILIIVIFSGTIMYYLEFNLPNTQFTSIPESMWWAVQTSICLGYGDIVPETYTSRYIALVVLYGGVVIVMVLILSLGGRVFDMYIKEFDESSGGFLNIASTKEDYEIHYKNPL